MKAYKVTLLVIDHDGIGSGGIVIALENTRYPNDCIAPDVKEVEEVEIGEWHDNHPLNKPDTADEEYEKLFP